MTYSYNPLASLGLDKNIPLDGSGKIPSDYLPSYVDDVVEYDDFASFPGTGETGKIYVAKDTGYTYRWTGSVYVRIGSGGEVNLNLGSEGSPSLYFTGDTNTGLYSPGTDQVALSTNGTGRVFVDASGNVSIGLSSSTTALNVTKTSSGTDSNTLLVQNKADAIGTTASIYLSTNTAGTGIERSAAIKGISGSGTGTELALFTNASGAIPAERLRITSAGLVGIGTSSPATLVEGRITGGGGTPASSGTSQPNAVFRVSGSGTTGVLDIGCNSGAPWIQSTDRADLSQKYDLLLNPNGGRVGIGTTSPGAKLEVNGGEIYNVNGTITQYMSTGGGAAVIGTFSNSDWSVRTNNVEQCRVDTSGRLLVGTSSDSGGALLQVNGDRIRVATAKTPASASDTGTTGEICWDASYIYVCTATNTWKRAALSTW